MEPRTQERAGTLRLGLLDLRRLLVGAEYPNSRVRAPGWWRRWRTFLLPAALLALFGLAVAASQYLQDERGLPISSAFPLGIGSALPAALVLRWPLLAWRIAYPMVFLGAFDAKPEESFPWNPLQIFCYLFLLVVLALRVDTGVGAWIGLLSVIPLYVIGGDLPAAYWFTVLVAVILLVGDQIRRRQRSQRALAEQAELSELEKARRAVLEERTRIARELHDVVAHHMSMIAVQAETAPYRLGALPDPARTEFTSIADSARQALTDMRRLLGVLRSEATNPETAPQPKLADVAALVEAARRAGIVVTLDGVPTAAEPPGAVGLAAYRIVQEALANAARHAPGTPVRVVLLTQGRELRVRVENGGGRPAVEERRPGGHGLTGMRERARLLGGTFTAGPTDDGFEVVARLPYDDPENGD